MAAPPHRLLHAPSQVVGLLPRLGAGCGEAALEEVAGQRRPCEQSARSPVPGREGGRGRRGHPSTGPSCLLCCGVPAPTGFTR